MLVIISKHSGFIANLTTYSSIQVMATLFYLSFAKLLLNVIDIFIPVNILTPHGEFTVWYVDCNMPYWRNSGHVALFITAIITILFYLLPFLLWTTCGSLLARRSRWVKKDVTWLMLIKVAIEMVGVGGLELDSGYLYVHT